MKRWKSLALFAAILLGVSVPAVASAQSVDVFDACTGINRDSAVCQASGDADLPDTVTVIVSTLFVVLGIICVVMIVIGGIRYASSAGDPAQVKRAKDTILYSVVGLIIAILAFSIVNFVLGRF